MSKFAVVYKKKVFPASKNYQNDEIWALSTNITKFSFSSNILLAVYKTLDLDWQIGFLSTGISIVFGIDS